MSHDQDCVIDVVILSYYLKCSK